MNRRGFFGVVGSAIAGRAVLPAKAAAFMVLDLASKDHVEFRRLRLNQWVSAQTSRGKHLTPDSRARSSERGGFTGLPILNRERT